MIWTNDQTGRQGDVMIWTNDQTGRCDMGKRPDREKGDGHGIVSVGGIGRGFTIPEGEWRGWRRIGIGNKARC